MTSTSTKTSFGEAADFDARTGRQGLLEVFAVNFVDSAEEVDVRQVNRRLDDVIIRKTGFFEDSADVLHALFGLFDDAAGNDFAFFRVDGDLVRKQRGNQPA